MASALRKGREVSPAARGVVQDKLFCRKEAAANVRSPAVIWKNQIKSFTTFSTSVSAK
jgi:hypothetical protein